MLLLADLYTNSYLEDSGSQRKLDSSALVGKSKIYFIDREIDVEGEREISDC